MENHQLQKWALIAEVIGGVAVLITLVILVIEIRNNSEMIRVSTFFQSSDRFNEFRTLVLTEPELYELFQTHLNGTSNTLDEEDSLKLELLLNNEWADMDSAFMAQSAGIFSEGDRQRLSRAMCQNYRLFEFDPELWERVKVRVTDSFANYLENEC